MVILLIFIALMIGATCEMFVLVHPNNTRERIIKYSAIFALILMFISIIFLALIFCY